MLELGTASVERDRVGLGGGDLGARARDVELGDVSRAPAALGEGERFAVCGYRASYERSLVIECPQGEIGLRHLGLHEQPRALQKALGCALVELRGVDRLGEAPEEIHLVGEIGASGEEASRRPRGVTDDALQPVRARADVDLRRALRVGGAHQGARLREARCGHLDAGVAAVGALHQLVERPIGERLPPFAARLGLGRRCRGPAAVAFLEGCRRRRQFFRFDLGQRGRAAGEQHHKKQGQTPFHD